MPSRAHLVRTETTASVATLPVAPFGTGQPPARRSRLERRPRPRSGRRRRAPGRARCGRRRRRPRRRTPPARPAKYSRTCSAFASPAATPNPTNDALASVSCRATRHPFRRAAAVGGQPNARDLALAGPPPRSATRARADRTPRRRLTFLGCASRAPTGTLASPNRSRRRRELDRAVRDEDESERRGRVDAASTRRVRELGSRPPANSSLEPARPDGASTDQPTSSRSGSTPPLKPSRGHFAIETPACHTGSETADGPTATGPGRSSCSPAAPAERSSRAGCRTSPAPTSS